MDLIMPVITFVYQEKEGNYYCSFVQGLKYIVNSLRDEVRRTRNKTLLEKMAAYICRLYIQQLAYCICREFSISRMAPAVRNYLPNVSKNVHKGDESSLAQKRQSRYPAGSIVFPNQNLSGCSCSVFLSQREKYNLPRYWCSRIRINNGGGNLAQHNNNLTWLNGKFIKFMRAFCIGWEQHFIGCLMWSIKMWFLSSLIKILFPPWILFFEFSCMKTEKSFKRTWYHPYSHRCICWTKVQLTSCWHMLCLDWPTGFQITQLLHSAEAYLGHSENILIRIPTDLKFVYSILNTHTVCDNKKFIQFCI